MHRVAIYAREDPTTGAQARLDAQVATVAAFAARLRISRGPTTPPSPPRVAGVDLVRCLVVGTCPPTTYVPGMTPPGAVATNVSRSDQMATTVRSRRRRAGAAWTTS